MVAETQVRLEGWPGRGAELLRVGITVQQQLQGAAGQIASELRTTAIDESPTGKTEHAGIRFRDGWVAEVQPEYQGGARVLLGNIAPHAPFVIYPTKPHMIFADHLLASNRVSSSPRPLNPAQLGYLRFAIGGQTIYRHSVHHPGTAGNPVHERANERMAPRYQDILREQAEGLAVQIAAVFH